MNIYVFLVLLWFFVVISHGAYRIGLELGIGAWTRELLPLKTRIW